MKRTAAMAVSPRMDTAQRGLQPRNAMDVDETISTTATLASSSIAALTTTNIATAPSSSKAKPKKHCHTEDVWYNKNSASVIHQKNGAMADGSSATVGISSSWAEGVLSLNKKLHGN